MAGTTRTVRRVTTAKVADFDDQIWPINVAILILAGFVAGSIVTYSRFDEPRLLLNTWFLLFTLALTTGLAFWAVIRFQGKVRHRVLFCTIISLLVHLWIVMYAAREYVELMAEREKQREEALLRDQQRELIPVPVYPEDRMDFPRRQQSFEVPIPVTPPEPIQPLAVERPPVEVEIRAEAKPPDELEIQQQVRPTATQRREPSAPRRADQPAREISRQPLKEQLLPNEPIPVQRPSPRPGQRAALSAPEIASHQPRENEVKADQPQVFENPSSIQAEPLEAKVARRATNRDPAADVPATPTPTRPTPRPAEVARTDARAPDPVPIARPSPEAEALRPSEKSVARNQADAPQLILPGAASEPAPTAPRTPARAPTMQRRPEALQLAENPRPIPPRRPRAVTTPTDFATPQPTPTPRTPRSRAEANALAVPNPPARQVSSGPSLPDVSQPAGDSTVGSTADTVAPSTSRRRPGTTQVAVAEQPMTRPTRSARLAQIESSATGASGTRPQPTPAPQPSPARPLPSTTVSGTSAGRAPGVEQVAAAGPLLPASTDMPQLPSNRARPRTPTTQRSDLTGSDPAELGSLAPPNRSAAKLPSTQIHSQAAPSTAPASTGGTPPSRLTAGNIASVRTQGAQPPTGNTSASAGTMEVGVGPGQALARTGQPRSTGVGRPTAAATDSTRRIARTPAPAGSLASSGAPRPSPASPGRAASSLAGPAAPSLNVRGTGAQTGGASRQLARQPIIGAGLSGAGGTPGPVAGMLPERVNRIESSAGEVAGSGRPTPGRTPAEALGLDSTAEPSQLAARISPGGQGAPGSPAYAPTSGAQRQVAGLPGGLQSQPQGGALAALGLQGASLPAAARRPSASQRQPGGADAAANQARTVKRSPQGADIPTESVALADAPKLGGGGVTDALGGLLSSLQQGPTATIRSAGGDVAAGRQTAASGPADAGLGSAGAVRLAGRTRTRGDNLPAATGSENGPPIERLAVAGPAVTMTGPQPSGSAGAAGLRGAEAQSNELAQAPTGALARGTAAEPAVGQPAATTGVAGDPRGEAVAMVRLSRPGKDDALAAAISSGAAGGPVRKPGAMQTSGVGLAAPAIAPPGQPAAGTGAAPDVGLLASFSGQPRRSAGLQGSFLDRTPVEAAREAGPAASTPGAVQGPRRLPQGDDSGTAVALEVGGGPHRDTDVAGLPHAVADATEERIPSATPIGTADAVDLADAAILGGAGRQEGGLPVLTVAMIGAGGLGYDPLPDAGIPSHRARRESETVHEATLPRFLPERSGGAPAINAHIPAAAFGRRDPGRRDEIARKQGAPEGNERAVEMGLDFFARNQFPDGHWSLNALPAETARWSAEMGDSVEDLVRDARELLEAGYDKTLPKEARETVTQAVEKHADGEKLSQAELDELARFVAGLGQMESDTAATGLALLAYLGAGYTHREDKHRAVVRRGLDWLIEHQKPDGELFTGGTGAARFYSNGIATIALCEAYGMTRDPELREPARKAVEFLIRTQHPTRGGWRYKLDSRGISTETDTSVTGWMLMALKSAQMAGLEVPDEAFEKIDRWLDSAAAQRAEGQYIYNPHADRRKPQQLRGLEPSLAMTGEAMLMRIYLGRRRDDPNLMAGADHLKENLPQMSRSVTNPRDCYYWYYATQAMYQMQDEHWEAWHDRFRVLLPESQVQSGALAGSWHPRRPVPDRWAHAGGRHYVTALQLLMLEVYYRHLPLFQELGK